MNRFYKKGNSVWFDNFKIVEIEGDELVLSEQCPSYLFKEVRDTLRENKNKEIEFVVQALNLGYDDSNPVSLAYISLNVPLESIQSIHRAITPTLDLLKITYNVLNNTHISIAYTLGNIDGASFETLMSDLSKFDFKIIPRGVVITRGTDARLTKEIPKILGSQRREAREIVSLLNDKFFPTSKEKKKSFIPLLKHAEVNNYRFTLSEDSQTILLNDGKRVMSLKNGDWVIDFSEDIGFDYLAIELEHTNELKEAIEHIESNVTVNKFDQFQGGFKFHISLFEVPKGILSDEDIENLSQIIETSGVELSPSVKLRASSVSAYNSNRELLALKKVA